jgi:4-hydroxy-3-polyprenylbenzoate decarboxylase
MQWKSGSGAFRHAELYRKQGTPMPVAVSLGGPPALLFSAMFPLPGTLDEVTFAGFLSQSPMRTAPCQSVPLFVPIGAEIVIEGYVDPDVSVLEGPFGNHTGFYSPASSAASMRITTIRHRLNPIIPATVVGPPPQEDCWMAKAWERLLLAFIRKLVPAIRDINFPFEWLFNQSVIISLENPCPGMVRNISVKLWALPWFRSARLLLFLAANSESIELSHAAWRSINVTSSSDDIFHDDASGRIAIDATGCSDTRPPVKKSAECEALVTLRWKEYWRA